MEYDVSCIRMKQGIVDEMWLNMLPPVDKWNVFDIDIHSSEGFLYPAATYTLWRRWNNCIDQF